MQAARTPDAIAVGYADAHLTYRALDRRANQLARRLRALGVVPEVQVGIALERSLELVVGLLGVLKAGGAYVPLDPAYPAERIAFMLEDTGATVVVKMDSGFKTRRQGDKETPHLLVSLSPSLLVSRTVVDLRRDWPRIAQAPDTPPPGVIAPNNLAYVICTSGSTARPKGAGVYHRGIVNLLRWWIADFTITSADRILLVTSLSFDLTQKNIFAPLLVGGALQVLASERYEPRLIVQTVRDQQITILNCTPSAFYPLIEALDEPAMRQLESLRYVFLGGEPIDVARLRRWTQSAHCKAAIVNTYGPTECTDIVASYQLPRATGPNDPPIPIGRPVFNTALFVVDPDLNQLPIGVPGELCVGGVGVGAGYLGRPELTAERFVPNPFGTINDERRTMNGETILMAPFSIQRSAFRLYKTGDLARYRADGAIDYLGRMDGQVKLRGYRIELGEIEATLRQHPAIRGAVALVREDLPGEQRLVAYVVTTNDQRPTTNDEGADSSFVLRPPSLVNELREFLRERLPGYMVPSLVMVLDALPLTPSGKIDRTALPPPDPQALAELQQTYVAPRTPVEETLAAIWAELLGMQRVGVHDNFFDLGGHSLLATRVLSRINETFNVELPLEVLFTNFTVAELARKVAQYQVKSADAGELASLLERLDALSDDEVKELLASA